MALEHGETVLNMSIEGIVDLLTANLWAVLVVVAAVGMLLGILFRGLMGRSRIRKAEVEAGIAQTELKQVQEELDALFAAQRKRQAEEATAITGASTLAADLEAQQARTAELNEELSAARTELEALRAEAAASAEPANSADEGEPVLEAAPTQEAVADDAGLTALTERNQWLEERVADLEAKLDQAPVPAAPAGQAGVAEEELAKLRWRNRYLEGRLAYYEDGLAAAAYEAASAEPKSVVAEENERSAPVLVAENGDHVGDESAAAEQDVPTQDEVVEESPHPSDAVLAALDDDSFANGHDAIEPMQPPISDRPSGDVDDLTQIGGIGPRIAEVLHELGIWSFDQIAHWEPEHAAWIEQQLAFQGRIARENWVQQAKSLI